MHGMTSESAGLVGPRDSYDEPVAPTRDDPFIAGGSTVLGGPLGRHAAVNRWLFSIMVIVCLGTAGTATLGWVQKASCMTHGYSHEYQYTRLCYSDIYALYYSEDLDKGAVPYKDHAVEYPVIIGETMRAAQLTADLAPEKYRSQWFFTVTAGILGASAILLVAVTVKLAGRRPWDAALLAFSPLLLFHIYTNWDLLAAAFTGFAMLAWARGKPVTAGLLIGLGVATKLYPLALLGALLLLCLRSRKMYEWSLALLGTVVAWVLANVWIIVNYRESWLTFWKLNQTRPADWDSLWFQLDKVLPAPVGADGVARSALAAPGGASDLLNELVAISLLIGLCLIALLVVRAQRRPRVPQVLFLILTVFLLTNKVFSPQYALWYLPVVVLAVPRWRLLLLWQLTELVVVTTRFYYFINVDKGNNGSQGIGESWFFSAVWIRDLMLLFLIAVVVRDILRPEHDVVRRSGMDDPAGGILDGLIEDDDLPTDPDDDADGLVGGDLVNA
ncbi:glycosyltransferase 87 family protein [Acidothermaceae bacterium B102]|nr:glycosyltransferase 87 family protein [Acidothermaceae bacterium B102]